MTNSVVPIPKEAAASARSARATDRPPDAARAVSSRVCCIAVLIAAPQHSGGAAPGSGGLAHGWPARHQGRQRRAARGPAVAGRAASASRTIDSVRICGSTATPPRPS